MSPDLEHLLTLGELDRKLIETRRRLRDAARLASPQESRVREARTALERIDGEAKRATREAGRLEAEAKAKQDEITKNQVALNSAKSNEEYQALLRAIDRGKDQIGELETQVLENYEAADKRLAEKKRYDERLRAQEAELAKANELVAKEEGRHREELERLEAERTAVVASISAQHLELYQRILEKAGDAAVAEVVDEICQGCYMRVRPEQVSKIRGGDEVVTCWTCGKILFGRFD